MCVPLADVGKYDRADDWLKLAMLAANVDYRYWTDDPILVGLYWLVILAPKSLPNFKFIIILIMTIKFET